MVAPDGREATGADALHPPQATEACGHRHVGSVPETDPHHADRRSHRVPDEPSTGRPGPRRRGRRRAGAARPAGRGAAARAAHRGPDAAAPAGRRGGHPGRAARGVPAHRPVRGPQRLHHLAAHGRGEQCALDVPHPEAALRRAAQRRAARRRSTRAPPASSPAAGSTCSRRWRRWARPGPSWSSRWCCATSTQLDYAEIARVLDLPLGTVKSRIHHARTWCGRC